MISRVLLLNLMDVLQLILGCMVSPSLEWVSQGGWTDGMMYVGVFFRGPTADYLLPACRQSHVSLIMAATKISNDRAVEILLEAGAEVPQESFLPQVSLPSRPVFPPVHSFNHSFNQSFTHSFIHSFLHLVSRYPVSREYSGQYFHHLKKSTQEVLRQHRGTHLERRMAFLGQVYTRMDVSSKK